MEGHECQKWIHSFDLFHCTHGPNVKPPGNIIWKLGCVYFLGTAKKVILFLCTWYEFHGLNPEKIIDYFTDFLFTLIIPVYIYICWAINFEATVLKEFIEQREEPTLEFCTQVKTMYCEMADQIHFINGMWCTYFSAVFVVMTFSVDTEGFFVLSGLILVFFGNEFDPPVVRAFVGVIAAILAQILLFCWQFLAAARANEKARCIQIALNDLLSRHNRTVTDSYVIHAVSKYIMKIILKEFEYSSILYLVCYSFFSDQNGEKIYTQQNGDGGSSFSEYLCCCLVES